MVWRHTRQPAVIVANVGVVAVASHGERMTPQWMQLMRMLLVRSSTGRLPNARFLDAADNGVETKS